MDPYGHQSTYCKQNKEQVTSVMNSRKKVKSQDGKKVDPDQTASVFTLFAQFCLSKYSRTKAVGSEDRRQSYFKFIPVF